MALLSIRQARLGLLPWSQNSWMGWNHNILIFLNRSLVTKMFGIKTYIFSKTLTILAWWRDGGNATTQLSFLHKNKWPEGGKLFADFAHPTGKKFTYQNINFWKSANTRHITGLLNVFNCLIYILLTLKACFTCAKSKGICSFSNSLIVLSKSIFPLVNSSWMTDKNHVWDQVKETSVLCHWLLIRAGEGEVKFFKT